MNPIVCQRIQEEIVPDKRLGRHVEHDPRSRAWSIKVGSTEKIHTVHHRFYGNPLNQLRLGSCTGNAIAHACNCRDLHILKTRLLKEDDAVSVYSLATSIDEFRGQYPPDDTGSSGLAAAKAAQIKGYITEYRHAFGIDEAMFALMKRPVITGVNWYEGFDYPDEHGLVKIEGQVRGGHEFAVLAYEMYDKCVIGINSWGLGYGLKGRFKFTVDTWERLLEEQGDVTILIR